MALALTNSSLALAQQTPEQSEGKTGDQSEQAPDATPAEPASERTNPEAASENEAEEPAPPPPTAAQPAPRPGPPPEQSKPPPAPPVSSVEPPPPSAPPAIYEPPPPPGAHFGPVPPPEPRHRSPKSAFWFGARLGWGFPSGNAWLDGFRAVDDFGGSICCFYSDRPLRRFAKSGPSLELNLGARVARNYNIYVLWQRTEFRNASSTTFASKVAGDGSEKIPQSDANSDLYGLGMRFSSDADDVGFLADFMLGYRTFHATWENGVELDMSALFATRIGLGADIRLTQHFSLSPLITLSGGAFDDVVATDPDGNDFNMLRGLNLASSHLVLGLEVGSHFDLY